MWIAGDDSLQIYILSVPSVEVAVMVTVFPFPAFLVVTIPLAFTVSYFLLSDFCETFLIVTFLGVIFAVSCTFFPAASFLEGAEILIFDALTVVSVSPPTPSAPSSMRAQRLEDICGTKGIAARQAQPPICVGVTGRIAQYVLKVNRTYWAILY